MKKFLSLLLISVFILSSCIADIKTSGDTETGFDESSNNTESNSQNNAVSDIFPVKSLMIGDNDISLYTVVYAENASDTVKYAADEFVSYIHASTGIHLSCDTYESCSSEYKIHIGKTEPLPKKILQKLTRMGNEGYYLLCEENNLYITGDSERGTLYGVYSFLEDHVGIRYYTPSCERILKAEKITIPSDLDTYFKPVFKFRDCFWYESFDPEFSAKQKINSCVSRDLADFGGGVTYADNSVNTLGALATTGNVYPCLTNEDVYLKVLDNAKKWLEHYPSADIISISQDNGNENSKGCTCKECTAINNSEGSSAAAFLTFINKLAEDLKKDDPDIHVDALISKNAGRPPKTVRPADNVIIRLSSNDSCFSHAVNECSANRIDEDIQEWGKICNNLYVWDCTTNFMFYLAPFPNLFTIYDNVKFYAENNVTGVFEQGNYHSASGEFGELRAYLLSKLLWDPLMTKEEYTRHMCDFLEGYYGEGWEHIYEYIIKTSEAAAQSHMLVSTGVKNIMGKGKSSEELAAFAIELSNLWTRAYNATTETVCRRHVEKSKIQIDYYTMYIFWDQDKHPALLQSTYELINKYSITHFREGKQIPYLDSFDKSPSTW